MRKLLILFVSALLPWLSVRSQKPVYKDAGQPVETRVKDLLNRMTLHEKVLQLNQYTFGENDNPNNIGTEVKNLPAEIGSLIYLHTDFYCFLKQGICILFFLTRMLYSLTESSDNIFWCHCFQPPNSYFN